MPSNKNNQSSRLKGGGATLNTKWLNNALKSIGAFTKSAFEEYSPNIMATANSTVDAMKSVKEFSHGATANAITNSLSSNKYVKSLNTAFKNAVEDVKSGNLNNQERFMSSMLDEDSDGDSYTVSTDDESGDASVSINLPDNSNNFATLSNQMQKGTEAQLKMAKATMDASIAVSAASIAQIEKIGSEMNIHLTNIENSVSALVQFNMNNMQKLIDTSIAYYERVGSTIESEYGKGNKRINAADVFNNEKGGINLSKYKEYIKQELKDTPAGMLVGTMMDDQILKAFVANPIGTIGNMVTTAVMPKVVKSTMESVEASFSAMSISLLEKLNHLGEKSGDTFYNQMISSVGKVFGLRSERTSKMDTSAIVKKDVAQFDGITKHALTEIIPKELREQTGYLKIIASHFNEALSNDVEASARVFDYNKGRYTTTNEINKEIAQSITDAITNAFRSGSFGKAMDKAYSLASEKNINDDMMERIMNEFYSKLERSRTRISIDEFANASRSNDGSGELNAILRSLGRGSEVDKKAVDVLISTLKDMSENNRVATEDFFRARFYANSERNNAIKNIKDNPYENNFFSSTLFNKIDKYGNPIPIDQVLDQFYNHESVGAYSRYSGPTSSSEFGKSKFDIKKYFNKPSEDNESKLAKNAGAKIKNSIASMAKFDYAGLFSNIASMFADGATDLFNAVNTKFFTPFKNMLMGSKRDDGYSEGGLISESKNNIIDFRKSVMSMFTGKDWTDSKGTTHKINKPEETVLGSLKQVRDGVMRGFKTMLTGSEDYKFDKNDESDKEPQSVFKMIGDTLRSGFEGWSNALFGKSLDDIHQQKDQIIDNISQSLPRGIAGAAMGAVAGGSVLGWFVGGPIGGALLGMATGIASKSDKFQEWFFGKSHEDNDGNIIVDQKGLLPSNLKDVLKENKIHIAAGALGGAISGGGVLGTLIGGPVAGAAIGLSTSLIAKSKTFQEFLYGDEKTGQRGILTTISSVFKKFNKDTVDDDQTGTALLGMSAVGAGAGALTGTLLAKMGVLGASLTPMGPIGGAVLGLGASIIAQKDNFHEWLFGKKNENGEKIKEGVFGQFTNSLKAHIINPMAYTVQDIIDDAKISFKYDILDSIRKTAEPLTEFLFGNPNDPNSHGVLGGITTKLDQMVEKSRDIIVDKVGKVVDASLAPIGAIVSKSIQVSTKVLINSITTPFKIISNLANFLVKETKKHFGGFFKQIHNGVSKILGGIESLSGKILGGIFSTASGLLVGGAGIAKYGIDKFKKNHSVLGKLIPEIGDFDGDINSFSDRWKYRKEQRKNDEAKAKLAKAERKQRIKNEKFINKWTKGQYVNDTDESRAQALIAYNAKNPNNQINNPEQIKKIFGIEALDQKKNAIKTGQGIPENGANINTTELPWEGKTFNTLNKMYEMFSNYFNPNKTKKEDKNIDSDTNPDRNHEINNKSKEEQAIENLDNKNIKKTTSDIVNDIMIAGSVRKYLGSKVKDALDSAKNKGKKAKSNAKMILDKLKSKLPGYAEGTSNAAAISVTGENGPEILVSNNGNTAIAPNGGGLPVFITGLSDFILSLFGKKKRKSNIYSSDNINNAANNDAILDDGKLGNSTDEIQNRKEDEKNDSKKEEVMNKIAESTDETKNATVEAKEEWSSIFGKKGLITAGAIGLILLLTKWFTKNDNLASIFSNALSGVGSGIDNLINQFNFRNDNNSSTNGKSTAELLNEQTDRGLGSVKKLASGDIIGAADNFIMGDDGKWDHQSAANAKMIGKHGANLAYKGYKLTSKVVNGVADSTRAIAKGADKVFTKVSTSATTLATDAALNMNPGSFISKALSLLDDALKTVVNAVNKSLGTKVGTNIFSGIITKVKNVLTKGGTNVIAKLGTVFGKETAKTVAKVIPLVNIAFIGISALNGLTGAARLFRVNKDDVDFKMRAISAAFAGLTATLPGTIIDVLNEIISELVGVDLLQSLAVIIYDILSSDEDSESLKNAQKGFQEEYNKYKSGEIDKSYENAVKSGAIDPSVSKEDYIAGVESGKYEAEYMSFEDYNEKNNKSFLGKVGSGAATIASKAWNATAGVRESIVAPFKGAFSFGKDVVGAGVDLLSGDMEGLQATMSGFLGKIAGTPAKIKESFDTARNSLKENKKFTMPKATVTDGNPLWWIESAGTFFASIFGSALGVMEFLGNLILQPFKAVGNGVKKIFDGVKNFFTGDKEDEVSSEDEGGRGSRYNGFKYYSQNDPRWANTKFTEAGGKDPFATIGNSGCGPTAMSMMASQLTGRDINPKSMARFAQISGNRDDTGTNWNFIDDSSKALGLNSKRAMKPSVGYIESQLRSGHPMILSGKSRGGRGAFTADGHYVVATGMDHNGNVIINDPRGKNYSGAYNLNDVASETGASWAFGGGRGDTVPVQNGAYYFAQNDPQWGGGKLAGFNDGIKNSGCVMTSAAMAASSILGSPINPGVFNSKYGNGNVSSTRWGDLGISCQRLPSGGTQGTVSQVPGQQIISALKAGKPVMLLGQKEVGNIYYDGGSTGPGTSHCVLATGLDKNGNIIVNDPWNSSNNTKKTQSFRLDQLNPFYWAQIISGSNGNGIAPNLKSVGMSGSYSTTSPSIPLNNHLFDNIALTTTDIKQLPKLNETDVANILLSNWANHKGSIFTQDNALNSAKGIVQAQNETGVSAIVPLSIGALESGWGTSRIAKQKGNLWGWAAYNSDPFGSATSFGTNQYGAFRDYTNNLLSTYYDGYGAKTIYQIGSGDNAAKKGYAYNANGSINKTWPKQVNSCGSRMISSLNGSTIPLNGDGSIDMAGNALSGGSSLPSESEDKSKNFLSTITDFMGEFANRAVSGLFTGNYDDDYSSVFNPETEGASVDSMNSSTLPGAEASGGRTAKVTRNRYSIGGGRGNTPNSSTSISSVNTLSGYSGVINSRVNQSVPQSVTDAQSFANTITSDDKASKFLSSVLRLLADIASSGSNSTQLLAELKDVITKMPVGGNVNINGINAPTTSSQAQSKTSVGSNRNGILADKIAHAG